MRIRNIAAIAALALCASLVAQLARSHPEEVMIVPVHKHHAAPDETLRGMAINARRIAALEARVQELEAMLE